MIDFKNLKLIKNKRLVKDPVRFPKVIDVYENASKRAFKNSIELEIQHVKKKR